MCTKGFNILHKRLKICVKLQTFIHKIPVNFSKAAKGLVSKCCHPALCYLSNMFFLM